jgi:hypothetical protein
MDAVEQRIASTASQLMILEKAFTNWSSHGDEQESTTEFKKYDIL